MKRYFLVSAFHPKGHTSCTVTTGGCFLNRNNLAIEIKKTLTYEVSQDDICVNSIFEFKNKKDFDDYND